MHMRRFPDWESSNRFDAEPIVYSLPGPLVAAQVLLHNEQKEVAPRNEVSLCMSEW